MFGHDRFGPAEKYECTYRSLGGIGLSDETVSTAITACFAAMNRIYEDCGRQESFPGVLSALLSLAETRLLSEPELALLEKVFANHEVGFVSEDYAKTLRLLAKRRRLALVTNIWSRKDKYVEELKRADVFNLFDIAVFSSDGFTVKPSRRLFDQAVRGLGVAPSEVLVVGDSLRCDVGGALAAGLRSVWISPNDKGPPSSGPQPSGWIRDLRELPSFLAH